MKTHRLKTWPKYYELVATGQKSFELRKDDRNFQEFDYVMLEEYDPHSGYTGNILIKTISLIIRDVPEFGLKEGYCIIQLI